MNKCKWVSLDADGFDKLRTKARQFDGGVLLAIGFTRKEEYILGDTVWVQDGMLIQSKDTGNWEMKVSKHETEL